MDAEKWQKVKELYEAAMELPPDERLAFIAKNCGNDEAIRREAESLVSFAEEADDFLERPAFEEYAEGILEETEKPVIGRKFLHYEVTGLLGAGGMGEIYLAYDPKLGRKAALKILPAEFTDDSGRMGRFIREAQAASALNHPNIITIYEINESEGIHFIASEYIEGETLRSLLRNGPLQAEKVLEIAEQIASALNEAHASGIFHRDIKPENIMIRPDGLVKVLDFGIAKVSAANTRSDEFETTIPDSLSPKPIHDSTAPGIIIGTANYMSPEQAKGKEVDGRSDIFSFGVVLYEMSAGRLPFEGEAALDTIGAILRDEPKPLGRSVVSPKLEKIIFKCLKKERDERYGSIREALAQIEEIKAGEGENPHQSAREAQPTRLLNATTDEKARVKTDEVAPPARFKAYLGAFLMAAVLLAGGIFAYQYFPQAENQRIESVAVMPFSNDGGDQEMEYLSDGMAETLISNLAQLPGLKVKSRTSVFRYKGSKLSPQQIGKELKVQAIVIGRVVQRGNELTLYIELVDAEKDIVLWKSDYKRQMVNLAALQGEITRDVSSRLISRLSGKEEEKLAKSHSSDPEAYQFFLKGRFFWNKRGEENIEKAIEQFDAAIGKDPNYARAYAGLADCYVLLPHYKLLLHDPKLSSSEILFKAKANALKALEIEEQIPEAHAALGLINLHLWNWEESEKAFKRAIELNPDYPTTHHWYSRYLRSIGRPAEGLAEIKLAHELDPLSLIILANLAQSYFEQGELDLAFEQCKKANDYDPLFSLNHELVAIYLKKGDFKGAVASALREVESDQRSSRSLNLLGYAYARSGKREEALLLVKELEARNARRKATTLDIAGIYAGLGDNDKTFEWIGRAFDEDTYPLAQVRLDPAFLPLHDDPRFRQIITQMKMPF